MARGVGEVQLFMKGDCFKYFRQKGRLFEGGNSSMRDGYYSRKYGM